MIFGNASKSLAHRIGDAVVYNLLRVMLYRVAAPSDFAANDLLARDANGAR